MYKSAIVECVWDKVSEVSSVELTFCHNFVVVIYSLVIQTMAEFGNFKQSVYQNNLHD